MCAGSRGAVVLCIYTTLALEAYNRSTVQRLACLRRLCLQAHGTCALAHVRMMEDDGTCMDVWLLASCPGLQNSML